MTTPISGIVPILATPFSESGEVDVRSFISIVELAIESGAHGLAMFGLASEYYKLTDEERRDLTCALIKATRNRVPVIVSVTHHATEVAVFQAIDAERAGAQAVMVLPPFFLSPSLDSILYHIEAIAAAIRIPIVLQYAPAQTGIGAEVLARLPVSILKVDASPALPVLRSLPPGITSLVGYMGLDLPDAVAVGCCGCMPTASLVQIFVKVWRSLQADPTVGLQEHRRMIPLLQYMMQSIEFLIAAEKVLLVSKGVIRSGYCRRPRALLRPEQIRQLHELFQNL